MYARVLFIQYIVFLWLCGRALHLQCKRLWVRFQGNTHHVKNVYPVYHCKSLWIKATAKCKNENIRNIFYRNTFYIYIVLIYIYFLYLSYVCFMLTNTFDTLLHFAYVYTHTAVHKFGISKIFYVFFFTFLCSPRLYLFEYK